MRMSTVIPGKLPTCALPPVSRLNSDDLPEFGRPSSAMSGRSVDVGRRSVPPVAERGGHPDPTLRGQGRHQDRARERRVDREPPARPGAHVERAAERRAPDRRERSGRGRAPSRRATRRARRRGRPRPRSRAHRRAPPRADPRELRRRRAPGHPCRPRGRPSPRRGRSRQVGEERWKPWVLPDLENQSSNLIPL